MKKKIVYCSTLLVTLCALSACNKNTLPHSYGKSKYVNVYNYFLGGGKQNITTYTYENYDKKVTHEVKSNQGQTDLSVFVTWFRDIEEYNNNYQIVLSISEDYQLGYSMVKTTYEYNSKGLLSKYSEYAQGPFDTDVYLIGVTEYTYDSDNRILSEIEKDDDESIKNKVTYQYGLNTITKSQYDYSEDEQNPEDVEITEIQFDLQSNTKTVTQKYTVSNYEPCDYVSEINVYNSKDQLIKHTQFDRNCYYTYNENGDITQEVMRRIKEGVETTNGEDLVWTFNDSGFLTKYEEFSVEEETRTINYTTLYSVDEDGYVTEEKCYEGDVEGALYFSSSYELSNLRDIYNLNLKDFEGLHKGTYNLSTII